MGDFFMRWRHLLLFLTLHFCFVQSLMGIKVTQSYFEVEKGKHFTRRPEGVGCEKECQPQRTFPLWYGQHPYYSNKESGVWGIFSGHGISQREWQRGLWRVYWKRYTGF